MKKPLILSTLALLALLLGGTPPARAASYNFSTNLVSGATLAASSTNATLGSAYVFPVDQVPDRMTLFISASGLGATTNGGLTVYLQRSRTGTSGWENPILAPLTAMKVQIDSLAASSNAASAVTSVEWFPLNGCKGVRVGPVYNAFGEAVSNFTVGAEMKVEK